MLNLYKKKSATGRTTKKRMFMNRLDTVVSLHVRMLGDWTCVKCGRRHAPTICKRPSNVYFKEIIGRKYPVQKVITTSHFWNRTNHAFRWEVDLLDPMCVMCHTLIENKKYQNVQGFNYSEYILRKVGKKRYDAVDWRYQSDPGAQYSDGELDLILQRKTKELLDMLKSNYYDEGSKEYIFIPPKG